MLLIEAECLLRSATSGSTSLKRQGRVGNTGVLIRTSSIRLVVVLFFKIYWVTISLLYTIFKYFLFISTPLGILFGVCCFN